MPSSNEEFYDYQICSQTCNLARQVLASQPDLGVDGAFSLAEKFYEEEARRRKQVEDKYSENRNPGGAVGL